MNKDGDELSPHLVKGRTKHDFIMINPESTFKKIWSVVLILLLIYTATIMPYKIALIEDDES